MTNKTHTRKDKEMTNTAKTRDQFSMVAMDSVLGCYVIIPTVYFKDNEPNTKEAYSDQECTKPINMARMGKVLDIDTPEEIADRFGDFTFC